ncbi:zinc transporter ZIP9-like isoform X2 [Limulus polyphemus]|uniref:Zinc transporter ZIP9-like isoform X2 n=1 Tax=Limulus polyphemus TaxID=6850 RepID=A0ABM1BIE0_LIMPO|nr:zinc transporter ZIP9-like isoform X2 [Limulus polyphemus]
MDEVIVLLLLSVTMFMGCYMAGVIPLVVTLSGDKLQLVTVLGAGMLVGTALSVIIPEGVNMLYSSHLALIRNQLLREQQITTDKAQLSSSLEKEHSLHILTDIGETHSVIGVTLVLGFIFMLLIDQIGSAYTRISNSDAEAGPKEDRYRITATLGLVVHAAADGIALGAAVTTSHTDIEMIVFLAIMLHKAPAAFGLVTFLLHEGLDRNRIRKHLLIFALAAPLLAVITYFSISQSTKEVLSTFNGTGTAMLFSAGTFLYVATVHVLPEVVSQSHSHAVGSDSVHSEHKGFRKMELFALVGGAIFPMLLSVGHHH